MAEDEFKDAGRYFSEGQYVSLPMEGDGERWTIEGWFIWLSGDGPLFATTNGSWGFVHDRGGLCAYRVGGAERITSVTADSVRDHWVYLAVAKDGSDVVLRVDDSNADHWDAAPLSAPLSEAVVMKDAVGFAADVAHYEIRVPDDTLNAHWLAGRGRV